MWFAAGKRSELLINDMSSVLADENISEISAPPPFPGINRQLLLGHGAPIDEQDRTRQQLDHRLLEQNRMLDNIQRGRAPRATDRPSQD